MTAKKKKKNKTWEQKDINQAAMKNDVLPSIYNFIENVYE